MFEEDGTRWFVVWLRGYDMAFAGYIESVLNLHTAEIRCKWLSGLVEDEFELPSVEKMVEQTKQELEIMKRTRRF